MSRRGNNATTLTHRFATESDTPLLVALNAQLVEDEGHPRPWTRNELAARWQQWLRHRYSALLFEQQGAVVAYALYRADEDAGIYLRHFFVCREHRREGIGREAFRVLVDEVLPPGARVKLDVLLHNEAAQSFWRALGFRSRAVSMELDTSRSGAPSI